MPSGRSRGANQPGVSPPAIFVLAVAAMLVLHWFVPGDDLPLGGWRLLGLVPLAAGVGLNWAVHDLFRRHRTTVKPLGEPSALVTRGPFRYTRNPMYLGGVLILLGVGILFGSGVPFLVIPVFWWIIHARFIRREETFMARRFGQEYEEYRKRVRRWL